MFVSYLCVTLNPYIWDQNEASYSSVLWSPTIHVGSKDVTLIRKARVGEEDAIHHAHMRSIREVCIHDHGEEEIRGWGYRERGNRFENGVQNGLVWVVEHNQQIEGLASMMLKQESAYIHCLYLTPPVLGKGLGRELLQIMIQTAKDAGMHEIVLESSLTAHKFYQSFGFVDSEPLKKVVIGGYPVRCIPMCYTIQ